jgi:hypothetical protein
MRSHGGATAAGLLVAAAGGAPLCLSHWHGTSVASYWSPRPPRPRTPHPLSDVVVGWWPEVASSSMAPSPSSQRHHQCEIVHGGTRHHIFLHTGWCLSFSVFLGLGEGERERGLRLGEGEREGRKIRAWENRRYIIFIDGLKRWRKDREHHCTAALTNCPFDRTIQIKSDDYVHGRNCSSPAMTWVHR